MQLLLQSTRLHQLYLPIDNTPFRCIKPRLKLHTSKQEFQVTNSEILSLDLMENTQSPHYEDNPFNDVKTKKKSLLIPRIERNTYSPCAKAKFLHVRWGGTYSYHYGLRVKRQA